MKNLQRGGEGIIAVSYEARARGIKRGATRYLRLVFKLSDWSICNLDSDWSICNLDSDWSVILILQI